MGNSLGRLRAERSGISRGWTEGKPWEIAWGESSGGKKRCGSDERVDGSETVGNSFGESSVGKERFGSTIVWTEGKPWEIAWGEVRGEGARRKRQ